MNHCIQCYLDKTSLTTLRGKIPGLRRHLRCQCQSRDGRVHTASSFAAWRTSSAHDKRITRISSTCTWVQTFNSNSHMQFLRQTGSILQISSNVVCIECHRVPQRIPYHMWRERNHSNSAKSDKMFTVQSFQHITNMWQHSRQHSQCYADASSCDVSWCNKKA